MYSRAVSTMPRKRSSLVCACQAERSCCSAVRAGASGRVPALPGPWWRCGWSPNRWSRVAVSRPTASSYVSAAVSWSVVISSRMGGVVEHDQVVGLQEHRFGHAGTGSGGCGEALEVAGALVAEIADCAAVEGRQPGDARDVTVGQRPQCDERVAVAERDGTGAVRDVRVAADRDAVVGSDDALQQQTGLLQTGAAQPGERGDRGEGVGEQLDVERNVGVRGGQDTCRVRAGDDARDDRGGDGDGSGHASASVSRSGSVVRSTTASARSRACPQAPSSGPTATSAASRGIA